MSSSQIMALATVQTTLGWSRNRHWIKINQLSDFALWLLADHDALLVGTSESRIWFPYLVEIEKLFCLHDVKALLAVV